MNHDPTSHAPLPRIVRIAEAERLHLPNKERRPLLEARDTGGALSLSLHGFGRGHGAPQHEIEDEMILVESGEFEFRCGHIHTILRESDFAFVPRGMARSCVCCSEPGALWIASAKPPHPTEASPKIVRLRDGRCIEAPGENVRVLLGSSESGGGLCLAESETPPLGEVGPRRHESFDVAFLIRAGRYEFGLSDARVQAQSGEVVWIPCGMLYSLRVVSPQWGRALLISTPGGLDEFLGQRERPKYLREGA